VTTVAWDGEALAADRRVTQDGTIICMTVKVRRCGDGRRIGAVGSLSAVHAVLHALESGVRPVEWPDEAEALEVMPDGRVFRHDGLGRAPVLGRFQALGSGRAFALAAMACGRSAAQAVAIAARFDHCTGDGVDALAATAAPRRTVPRGRRRAG